MLAFFSFMSGIHETRKPRELTTVSFLQSRVLAHSASSPYFRDFLHLFHIQDGAEVGLQLFVWKIIQYLINNTRMNSVPCTHNCKPTFGPRCVFPELFSFTQQEEQRRGPLLFRSRIILAKQWQSLLLCTLQGWQSNLP